MEDLKEMKYLECCIKVGVVVSGNWIVFKKYSKFKCGRVLFINIPTVHVYQPNNCKMIDSKNSKSFGGLSVVQYIFLTPYHHLVAGLLRRKWNILLKFFYSKNIIENF